MSTNLLNVEVVAENLDTAVESALKQLDCSRADADVEVLQMHSNGFLGLVGKREARVLVKLHDRGAIAKNITKQLLSLSDLSAEVSLSASRGKVELILTGDEPSRLIGRHGQTLDALEALVSTMTDRLTTDRCRIILDVDGYRERRRNYLKTTARRMTRQVRKSGKSASSPPLSQNERRILHNIFKQESDLESRSKNHDGGRKVIVLQPRG